MDVFINRISELIIKHLNGELNSHEQAELQAWTNRSAKEKEFFDQITDQNHVLHELERFYSYDEKKGWEKINAQYEIHETPVIPISKNAWRWTAVAAVIFLLVGLGSYFIFFNKSTQPDVPPISHQQQINNIKILPGQEGAILTMANGQKIILDSARNGELASEGNIKTILKDGQVVYQGSQPATSNQQPVAFNTMTTLRGRQFSLVLADGSKVWLNASSSITYPISFTGSERKVSITGEAYFEIAHNPSKPFIVEKGDARVRVLGTHFNVNAYDDEDLLKVTLLEGSIKLQKASITVMLQPGQQGQIDPSGAIRLNKDADIDESIAWKNGNFNFNSADITNIMRQISRWYDVNVFYEGTVSKKTFSGIVSRNSNISHVLNIMEQAGIKFRMEGNKIIVINKG